jgi:hypothetical protein
MGERQRKLIRQRIDRLTGFGLAEFLAWHNDQCGRVRLFGGGRMRTLSLSLSLSLSARGGEIWARGGEIWARGGGIWERGGGAQGCRFFRAKVPPISFLGAVYAAA